MDEIVPYTGEQYVPMDVDPSPEGFLHNAENNIKESTAKDIIKFFRTLDVYTHEELETKNAEDEIYISCLIAADYNKVSLSEHLFNRFKNKCKKSSYIKELGREMILVFLNKYGLMHISWISDIPFDRGHQIFDLIINSNNHLCLEPLYKILNKEQKIEILKVANSRDMNIIVQYVTHYECHNWTQIEYNDMLKSKKNNLTINLFDGFNTHKI